MDCHPQKTTTPELSMQSFLVPSCKLDLEERNVHVPELICLALKQPLAVNCLKTGCSKRIMRIRFSLFILVGTSVTEKSRVLHPI